MLSLLWDCTFLNKFINELNSLYYASLYAFKVSEVHYTHRPFFLNGQKQEKGKQSWEQAAQVQGRQIGPDPPGVITCHGGSVGEGRTKCAVQTASAKTLKWPGIVFLQPSWWDIVWVNGLKSSCKIVWIANLSELWSAEQHLIENHFSGVKVGAATV